MNRLAFLTVSILLTCLFIYAHADERALAIRKKAAASTERRIALVIGNSGYEDAPLKNPVNDADTMANALKEAGFEVIVRKNADRRAMFSSIKEFGQRLKKNDVGLFYYAGHGVQVESANYLLPVDLRGGDLQDADDLRRDALPLSELMERMRDAGTSNIVILDACRDNPFLAKLSRSSSRGLAKVVTPASTSVLYSTDPGNTASDGSNGDNGVFTKRLVETIKKDGLELVDVMREVSVAVNRDTNGAQRPVFDGVLSSKFYFHPADSRSPQTAESASNAITVDPKAVDFRYWESAERANTISAYKSYMKRFPNGDFVDLANEKLQALEGTKSRNDEAAKMEIERKARETAEQLISKERAEQERRQSELENKRKIREVAEQERIAKDRAEQERRLREMESERKARETAEQERLAKERAEHERLMRELEAKFIKAEERARQMEEKAAKIRQAQEDLDKEQARKAAEKSSSTRLSQDDSPKPQQVAMIPKFDAPLNTVATSKEIYKHLLLSDLTVSDTRTGLLWAKNGNITGDKISCDKAESFIKLMNSKNYAGFSDWRLPTNYDYKSLFNTAKQAASINNKLPIDIVKDTFTNFQDWDYWSSTNTSGYGVIYRDSFDLEYGTSKIQRRSEDLYIMLVRGQLNNF